MVWWFVGLLKPGANQAKAMSMSIPLSAIQVRVVGLLKPGATQVADTTMSVIIDTHGESVASQWQVVAK